MKLISTAQIVQEDNDQAAMFESFHEFKKKDVIEYLGINWRIYHVFEKKENGARSYIAMAEQ